MARRESCYLLGVMGLVALVWGPGCPTSVVPTYNGNGNANSNTNDNGGSDNVNSNTNSNTNDNVDNGGNDNEIDPDLALFTDPDSGFSTTVARDVDDETVQFSVSRKSIIYQDGIEYDVGSWTAEGNFLAGGDFQIRFGSVGGEKRAYFTEAAPGTICNFVVTPDQFQIFPTSQVPPQD